MQSTAVAYTDSMRATFASIFLFTTSLFAVAAGVGQTSALAPGATEVATWNTSSGNTVYGTLDGVSISLNATTSSLSRQTCDFSDSSKFSHPAGASEHCYQFSANSVLTFTFGSAITNPELYFWYLRSDASPYAVSTTGGSGTVSVVSGMTNGSASNTTITQSTGFGTGIVKVAGTVTGVTITSNAVGSQNYSAAIISIGRTNPPAATTTSAPASSSSSTISTPASTSTSAAPGATTTTVKKVAGSTVATTTTSTTTTTTTTTIPAPESPSVDPGEGIVTIDGEDMDATISRANDTLSSAAGGITTTLSVTQEDGSRRPLNVDGVVVMMDGDTLTVETTGLAPSTEADLWLYPGGKRLDTTKSDSTGRAETKVPVPAGLKSGRYKVTVSSRNLENKPIMSTVGLVMEGKAARSTSFWIWLLIALAILVALAVPTTLRIRKNSQSQQ